MAKDPIISSLDIPHLSIFIKDRENITEHWKSSVSTGEDTIFIKEIADENNASADLWTLPLILWQAICLGRRHKCYPFLRRAKEQMLGQ